MVLVGAEEDPSEIMARTILENDKNVPYYFIVIKIDDRRKANKTQCGFWCSR